MAIIFKAIMNFISYWYFRYLLVSELYMVEKWERMMFHVILLVFLSLLSVFNNSVVLSIVSLVTGHLFGGENLHQPGTIHSEL